MARPPKGTLVTLGPQRRPFQCTICGDKLFRDREATAPGFWGSSAIGLECMGCGYLHTFLDGGKVDMWRPDFGYPK